MAQNTRLPCLTGVWTKLTSSLVTTDISVMLASATAVSLQATSGTTPPTDNAGPLELLSYGDGWSGATIAAKFPGVSSADTLWAKPRSSKNSIIGISHG